MPRVFDVQKLVIVIYCTWLDYVFDCFGLFTVLILYIYIFFYIDMNYTTNLTERWIYNHYQSVTLRICHDFLLEVFLPSLIHALTHVFISVFLFLCFN